MANQQAFYSTWTLLRGICSHLSQRRRKQLGLLLLVMLASGGAELISLGSVLPFLAVLSDPEMLWQQELVQAWASRVGLTAASELLFPATLMFISAAVFAALVRLLNLWLNVRLAAALGSDLSCEAYRRTLYQPYSMHMQANSASLINSITTQIGQTVNALYALLQLLTSVMVSAGLLSALLLIDAPVALAALALFCGVYWALAITTRRELIRNGHKILEGSTLQLKSLQEGLGAIRDVLLNGNQPTYLHVYRQADRPHRKHLAKNIFLGSFPRYVLEALAMVAIAIFGGLLVLQRSSGAAVIPLLGSLALGAQRLLPALQQIYNSWAVLKGSNSAMQAVLQLLNQPLPPVVRVAEPLVFRESIRFDGVHFRYRTEQPEVLHGIDLEIRRGERIGLIGRTGSGKSTLVDLLIGLLQPSNGRLLVDGVDLHDKAYFQRLIAWRAAVAVIPQRIYLADSSIAENIAFGIPKHSIDLARVIRAAKQAQISDFIESKPEGYSCSIGERGIRLSGGQRQRIGIARALYKQASVIIFDEATSALDTNTEKALMESVESLTKELTIVMVAHRLTTLQRCDRVLRIHHGKVVASGLPSQILEENS